MSVRLTLDGVLSVARQNGVEGIACGLTPEISRRREATVGWIELLDGNTRYTERGLSVMQARHEVMRAGQALREAAGYESTTSVRAVTLHTEGQHQPGYVLGKMMVAPGPEIYPAPLWWHLPPNA